VQPTAVTGKADHLPTSTAVVSVAEATAVASDAPDAGLAAKISSLTLMSHQMAVSVTRRGRREL
jgi:hypothetical protein